MKKYIKFLEEISLKGNPGIPGESNDHEDDRKKWRQEVQGRAKSRLGIRPEDERMIQTPFGPIPVKQMEWGSRIIQLSGLVPPNAPTPPGIRPYNGPTSMQFVRGNEDKLAELALDVFNEMYGDIIARYNIKLDFKIVLPRQVKSFFDESENDDDEQRFRILKDEMTKLEIHKRKIANMKMQGEAKNTKHVLHSDSVKEGLEKIYGRRWREIFDVWDEISKLSDKIDWIIPIEVRQQMMENDPDFISGAVKIDWEKEDDEDEDEDQQNKAQAQDDEAQAQAQAQDDDYEEDDDSQISTPEVPVIRARAIDFPMLIHEGVKGLFEILSIGGIPEDVNVAKTVVLNTGKQDEPEDWKYGPEIAMDIRDFVNKNPKIDTYPNLREELWKVMVDKKTMPVDEFLKLIKGILNNTEKAKNDINRLLDSVINKIKSEKEAEEKYQRDMEEWEMRQKEKKSSKNIKPEQKEEKTEGDIDYTQLSPSELQELIDTALDEGDYEKVKKLSSFLKESKKYR